MFASKVLKNNNIMFPVNLDFFVLSRRCIKFTTRGKLTLIISHSSNFKLL